MTEDIETIILEFDKISFKIYSEMWRQLSEYATKIDRDKEENVFKMQAAKFAHALKQSLGTEVKKALAISPSQIYNRLQAALSARVNYYLQQFQAKCNSL